MQGVHFVVDDQGRRTAVQIDLDEHGEIWEEFCRFRETRRDAEELSEDPREVVERVRRRRRSSRRLSDSTPMIRALRSRNHQAPD